jgi:putative DNA primase/helicase
MSDKIKTRDAARNKWHEILPMLGVDAKYLTNRHGPCPSCGGKDRFRWDNQNGNGTFFCQGCGSGDAFKLLELVTGQNFPKLAARVDEIAGNIKEGKPVDKAQDATKVRRRLQRIGSELRTIQRGDPVSQYLHSRGIRDIPAEFLRLHPGLVYWEQTQKIGNFPAMVAAFRDPSGRLETMHVTYLTPDGHKAPVTKQKKVLGKQRGLAGGAIRLSDIKPHIGICEGIETALSITALYGQPCWACYSAHALSEFIAPAGIESVTIYADADRSYTGQAAATAAAKRLIRDGIRAEVAEFLPYDIDYNDLLKARLTHVA